MNKTQQLPKEMRENWFHAEFGSVQRFLRDQRNLEVIIDFSDVEWVDPLPFLTLILELKYCVERKFISRIQFDLGEYGYSDSAKRKARARKFLALHRYIDCLAENFQDSIFFTYTPHEKNEIYWGCKKQEITTLIRILSLDKTVYLAYGDKSLIPPRLVTTSNWEAVVAEAVKDMDHAYFKLSKERRPQRDTILQRTREVLFELIRNATEHAYNTNSHEGFCWVALYARLRPHLSQTDQVNVKNEKAKLIGSNLLPEASWIELYVCDVGGQVEDEKCLYGIFTDAGDWVNDVSLNDDDRRDLVKAISSAKPEANLASYLYCRSISRHGRAPGSFAAVQRGHITGLRYLDSILARHKDVSCLFAGRTCRYDSHPFSIGTGFYSGKEPYLGTGYRVCLMLSEPTKLPNYWVTPSRSTKFRASISEYLEIGADKPREIKTLDIRSRGDKFSAKLPENIEPIFMVRLPRQYDKNRCTQLISSWLLNIGNRHCKFKKAILILADISRAQAHNIETILHSHRESGGNDFFEFQRLEIFSDIFPESAEIIIITEDLACVKISATISKRKYDIKNRVHKSVIKIDDYNSEKFVGIKLHVTPLSKIGDDIELSDLIDYAAMALSTLKEIDSSIFWNRIREIESEGQVCLWGPVDWDGDILKNYLNFPIAMQDSTLARTLRRALRRMLALYPHTQVTCMDILIETELRDAAKWLDDPVTVAHGKKGNDRSGELAVVGNEIQELLVGSVYFTGKTLRRHLENSDREISAVIECFAINDDWFPIEMPNRIPHIAAMSWEPKINVSQGELWILPRYKKERSTPFIQTIGENVRSVLSFKNLNKPGVSQSPQEMYHQFIYDGIVKIGHWHYGKHHSLIDVNLALALQNYMVTRSGYFEWLSIAFDAFFGISEANNGINGSRIVVYPWHRLSSLVVRYFKKSLPEEVREQFKFVPLYLLDSTAGGIGRLAQISELAIQDALGKKNAKSVPIAVFDIGFISKRTLRYIRRQLKPMGFQKIQALGMINRSSAPAFLEEEENHSVSTYWRWNVPILGRHDQCFLCSALRTFSYMEAAIRKSHAELNHAVTSLKETWTMAAMEDSWQDHGIDPQRLASTHWARFGFSQSRINDTFKKHEDDANSNRFWHYVRHDHSTSLVAHYIEIARYTGDVSPLLKALRKDTFSPLSAVEALSTFIVLCGKSMNLIDQINYLDSLIHAVMRLDLFLVKIDRNESDYVTGSKLIGLATLVVLGIVDGRVHSDLYKSVHLSLFDFVISSKQIGQKILTHQTSPVRLFFVILVSILKPGERKEFEVKKNIKLKAMDTDILTDYKELTFGLSMDRVHPAKLWRDLEIWLGRGGAYDGHIRHDGRAISNLIEAKSADNSTQIELAICTIDALASLFGGDDGGFFESIGIGFAKELVDDLYSVILSDSIPFQKMQDMIDRLKSQFKAHLIRCAEDDNLWAEKTIGRALSEIIDKKLLSGEKTSVRFNECEIEWISTNYLPWCQRTQEELKKHINGALQHGKFSKFYKSSETIESKVWLELQIEESGLFLKIHNLANRSDTKERYENTPAFLKNIGGGIFESRMQQSDGAYWYTCEFFIPWLATIINLSDNWS